jgi:hypothetical protein
MLTEILGVIEKTNTRPLLTAMITISLLIHITEGTILVDPFIPELILLPILGFFADALLYLWIYFIHLMNSRLQENDTASWGPLIGSSLLAFCLLLAFSYLSSHPKDLSLSLLAQPNFIYLCTAFLLATETNKIRRYT